MPIYAAIAEPNAQPAAHQMPRTGELMALLELHPLIDLGQLGSIYRDPYVSRVGHDHRAAEPIIHPNANYLGAYVDGELVGAFLLIESGFIETDLHALLTIRALEHSRELGRLCIDAAFSDPNIQRVTAYVIEGLTTARNYCLKLGFQFEGIRRNACMQNGELLGVHILGMIRKEWEESK